MLLNTTRSLKLAKVANAMFSHSYVFFPTNWQLTRRYYRLETNILKLLIHIDSNVWREIETTFCIFLEALYSNNVSLDSGQIRSSSSYRLTGRLTVWSRTAAWLKWCLDSTVLSAEDYHTHTQRRRTVTADRFLTSNELISDVAASWSSECHLCVSVIKQQQVRWCRRKQISIVPLLLLLVTDLLKTCFVQKQSAGGSGS